MSLTLASPTDASPSTMARCGEFKAKLVVKHTFLELAPSETGAADIDTADAIFGDHAPPCTLRRVSSDSMIDYKFYGDDSDGGSVRCSVASLDTSANSELVSDLQSIAWEPAASSSSSDYMSHCGNGRWCDLNTDDEGEINIAEKITEAKPSAVVDHQGSIWQQGAQECCPMFYFTPMSGEHQAMALKAQASQLMAQAKQAEDAAQLARAQLEASLRTAGQHAKRTKRRAPKGQHKGFQQQWPEQQQWQQHCPQSRLPDCATASFHPVAAAAVSKSCSAAPSAELVKPTKLADCSNNELTTIMLRNMPTDLTRDMLLELLDSYGFLGCYNFVYLPFHLLRLTGLGHAFVVFATSFDAKRAKTALEGFSSWPVTSDHDQVCEVSWANSLQGLSANIEFFRNSPVMHETVPEEYKPILFQEGIRQPFPFPTKQIQPPRVKCGGFVVASLSQ